MGKITIEIDNVTGDKAEKVSIIKGLCEMMGVSILHDLIEGVEPNKETVSKIKTRNTKKPEKAKQVEEVDDMRNVLSQENAEDNGNTEDFEEEESGEVSPEELLPKIRTLVKKHIEKHRDGIKKTLTKLGATSVPDLDKAKYAKFYDYLVNL